MAEPIKSTQGQEKFKADPLVRRLVVRLNGNQVAYDIIMSDADYDFFKKNFQRRITLDELRKLLFPYAPTK